MEAAGRILGRATQSCQDQKSLQDQNSYALPVLPWCRSDGYDRPAAARGSRTSGCTRKKQPGACEHRRGEEHSGDATV